MTSARHRAAELIAQSDRMPWSPECGALLLDAAAIADAGGEDQLAYAARLRLIDNCSIVEDSDLLLSTFSQALQQHRRDPERFPLQPDYPELDCPWIGTSGLAWYWKWVCSRLMDNPAVALADLVDTVEEMAEFYRSSGLPGKAVLQERLALAVHRGDVPAIRSLVDQIEITPDDYLADCAACSRTSLARAALQCGDDDRALAIIADVLEQGLTCRDEPAYGMALVLPALAKAGRAEDLATYQARSAAGLTGPEGAPVLAQQVAILAQCGQPRRAVTLVNRHLSWLAHDKVNVVGLFNGLLAIAIAGEHALAAGLGQLRMPSADAPELLAVLAPWGSGAASGTATDGAATEAATAEAAATRRHTVAEGATVASLTELTELAWRTATEIGRAFDARNGTNRFADDVARARVRATTTYPEMHLQVTPEPEEAFADWGRQAMTLFRLEPAPTPVPENGLDAADITWALHSAGRGTEAELVARQALADYPAALDRARVLRSLAAGRAQDGDLDGASTLLDELIATETDAGFADFAALTKDLGLLGLRKCTAADAPEVTRLQADWTAAGVDPALAARALLRLRDALADAGDFDAIEALIERARPLDGGPIDALQPGYVGDVEVVVAWERAVAEQTPQRWERARQLASARLEGAEREVARAMLTAVLGETLLRLDRPADAVGLFTEAFEHHQRFSSATIRAQVACRLADAAAAAGAVTEARAAATFAAELAERDRFPSRCMVWGMAAEALGVAGALDEAHEVVDHALNDAELTDPGLLARLFDTRARVRVALRNYEGATDDYLESAGCWEAAGVPSHEVRTALTAAQLLADRGLRTQARAVCSAALATAEGLPEDPEVAEEARELLARLDNPGTDDSDSDSDSDG
jgi:tetratricopeptide (TPR) repeat protein